MEPEQGYTPWTGEGLTEEQMAVVFAMTSRSPDPFDEIAERVSQEKAADFHEKWVLDYGHASVAEHAVLHMAVENISRVACDELENNRLASYTEKSSRYQVIEQGSYHIPAELGSLPELRDRYVRTMDSLFTAYHELLAGCIARLKEKYPREDGERNAAYELRMRRTATDACRGVLPAATLTNAGMTANARTMEHAISKLLSSSLAETKELGAALKEQGQNAVPTLIKYADRNPLPRGKIFHPRRSSPRGKILHPRRPAGSRVGRKQRPGGGHGPMRGRRPQGPGRNPPLPGRGRRLRTRLEQGANGRRGGAAPDSAGGAGGAGAPTTSPPGSSRPSTIPSSSRWTTAPSGSSAGTA